MISRSALRYVWQRYLPFLSKPNNRADQEGGTDRPHSCRFLDADRPITSISEDKLGRGEFAKRLADTISAWQGKESLVIGLSGRWGSGKSSVKNLLVECLNANGKFHVMEFSPWGRSGDGLIAAEFVSELSRSIGAATRDRALNALLDVCFGLALFGHAFTKSLFRVYSLILGSSIGLTVLAFCLFSTKITLAVLVFLSIATSVTGILQTSIQKVRALFLVHLRSLTLEDVKGRVSKLLRAADRPTLVVVEDLDRISPSEAERILRLIRSNADFPNLVYLLLYDRTQLLRLLTIAFSAKDDRAAGEFLEKIIQVSWSVPMVRGHSLEAILFHELEALVGGETWDASERQRWSAIYTDGLRHYLANLRRVKQLLGSLAFKVEFFKSSCFEINPVDLIALESLRLFDVELFKGIEKNRGLLTSQYTKEPSRDMEAARAKADVDALLESSCIDRHAARAVVLGLFPSLERLCGDWYSGALSEEKAWFQRRLCHPHLLESYFALALDDGDISRAEIDGVLVASRDLTQLRNLFSEYRQNRRLETLLERLDWIKDELPLQHVDTIITATMEAADWFPVEPEDLFFISPQVRAVRIVLFLLKRLPLQERAATMFRSIDLCQSAIVPLDVAESIVEAQHSPRGDLGKLMSDDVEAEEIRKSAVKRFCEEVQKPEFNQHEKLGRCLKPWGIVNPDGRGAWLQSLLKEPSKALSLLRGILTVHQTDGKKRRSLDGQLLKQMFDVAVLRQWASTIDANDLNEEQITALEALIEVLNGQSDNHSNA